MTRHLFATPKATLKERWSLAFPQAAAIENSLLSLSKLEAADNTTLWIDCSQNTQRERSDLIATGLRKQCRVVVMDDSPNQTTAAQSIADGAAGYCHSQAAPNQLAEIALVVEHGGLWAGPELIQQLIRQTTARISDVPETLPYVEELTEREQRVAQEVAKGLTNREIAEQLNITERTVKAHLTTIFEKLDLRDRVALALMFNGIKTNLPGHA